jgi:NAD(P)-dependent dehydrogenase (short-subunit alcohol dehydrogenase family)
VNCIAPGLTRTERTNADPHADVMFDQAMRGHAVNRAGMPDAAAFMTGQTLIINGGIIKTM